MKKFLKCLATLLVICTLGGPAFAQSAGSEVPKVGLETTIGQYCEDAPGLIATFSKSISENGVGGYIELMESSEPCFDARIPAHAFNGIGEIPVTLTEKFTSIQDPEKVMLEVWLFKTPDGKAGFTWFVVKGQST